MSAYAFRTTWGAYFFDGVTRFRLWAPAQKAVALCLRGKGETLAMTASGDGWFELTTDRAQPGDAYAFEIGGRQVPDPASRAQTGDVHGPSRVVDPQEYHWTTGGWRGRAWAETVIYELHVGTFSAEGSFAGVERKLDYLAELGVTALELMPVAQFSGGRGWGYDGVLPYAAHIAYGGPEGLKRLVDAAHARRLMVFLDVVYNHFGPDGNYLHHYAPDFFHPEKNTPWGAAIAYEKPAVRRFFIENALYWLEEFRLDGLRLDAVDQIGDPSLPNLLEELAGEVRSVITDRTVHLTTEDDRNIVSLHGRNQAGRPLLYDGEWNDDFHHAAHILATGETAGYYEDYSTDVTDLAKSLAEGFVYQGQPSRFREGAARGEKSAGLPPAAFINFLQNHDQTGNRAFGERLTSLADAGTIELLLAILLLAPSTPLLFMGEEWGDEQPFYYFTDFEGELATAVREGRREEFRKWPQFADPGNREKIPDPNQPATAQASRPDWSRSETKRGRQRLQFVKSLLSLRANRLVNHFAGLQRGASAARVVAPLAFSVTWTCGDLGQATLYANLGVSPVSHTPPPDTGETVYELRAGIVAELLLSGTLPARSVAFLLEERRT